MWVLCPDFHNKSLFSGGGGGARSPYHPLGHALCGTANSPNRL